MTEIPTQHILREVMSKIASARQSVFATMDLSEELAYPLPRGYFSLLGKKTKEGIRVVRLAFGTEKEFQIFMRREIPKYTCKRVPRKNYRRMILIDEKILFFAKEKGEERTYFQTTEGKIIKEYENYFNSFNNL